MELLHPFLDGINEKGLYVNMFHDPQSNGNEAGGASGLNLAGIPLSQSVALLLDTRVTVEKAKLKILSNRMCQAIFRCHLLIADATGNTTVFEIKGQGEYPEPCYYPDLDREAELDTFTRQLFLRDCYAGLITPFKKEDATAMMTSVHCSFVDDKKAAAGPKERTLSNCACDLTKPELCVGWYLGDVEPIEGTNHIQD